MSDTEHITERYEAMRLACLRVGNLHPDSKSVCHQALERARIIPDGATHELALLADDLKLFIDQLQAENAALRKDSERFVWWFDDTDKGQFLTRYMQGMQEHWSVDRWRAEIDDARKQEPT